MEYDWLAALVEMMDDCHAAAAWLCAPHPRLGDESPLELVAQGRQDEVAELVERLVDGDDD